jgi:hypothetical protein
MFKASIKTYIPGAKQKYDQTNLQQTFGIYHLVWGRAIYRIAGAHKSSAAQ